MGEATPQWVTNNQDSLNLGPIVDYMVGKVPDVGHYDLDLRNTLIDLISGALDDVITRFNEYTEKLGVFNKEGNFKRNMADFRTSVQCVERYIMHQYRQRVKTVSQSLDVRNEDVFVERRQSASAHRQALNKCRNQIISELNIDSSDLMDELIGEGLMSESERESIVGKPTRKSRLEDFFRLISGRVTFDQTKNILLPAFQKNHPWISKEIIRNMKQDAEPSTCVCCRMKDQVEIKRIADYLLTHKVITLVQHADLTNTLLPNSTKWRIVLENRSQNVQSVVIAAFENTYPDIFNDFQFSNRNTLDCFCQEFVKYDKIADSDGSGRDSDGDDSINDDVARLSDIMSITTVQSDIKLGAYRMQPMEEKLCVIVCNSNYTHLDTATRDSLTQMHDTDVENINKCFRDLNFTIECCENQRGSEVVALLQQLTLRDMRIDRDRDREC